MNPTAQLPQSAAPQFAPGPGIAAREPAIAIGAVTGVVDAGLVLLFSFFTSFSAEQQAAILSFATPAVAMLAALVTRTQVTPAVKVEHKLKTAHAVGLADETLQVEA